MSLERAACPPAEGTLGARAESRRSRRSRPPEPRHCPACGPPFRRTLLPAASWDAPRPSSRQWPSPRRGVPSFGACSRSRTSPTYSCGRSRNSPYRARLCRRHLGCSSEKVIERLLEVLARRALLHTDRSVMQIGADLGRRPPLHHAHHTHPLHPRRPPHWSRRRPGRRRRSPSTIAPQVPPVSCARCARSPACGGASERQGPPIRYARCTRFRSTRQPTRRSRQWSRRLPHQSFSTASVSRRARSAVSSRVGADCCIDRPKLANRQVRRSVLCAAVIAS